MTLGTPVENIALSQRYIVPIFSRKKAGIFFLASTSDLAPRGLNFLVFEHGKWILSR